MSAETALKSLLSKFSFPQPENPSCWSILKVEKVLGGLGIGDYDIKNEAMVVSVGNQGDLIRILFYLVPYEVSSDYHLILSKFNDKVRLQIGCWQFEASA